MTYLDAEEQPEDQQAAQPEDQPEDQQAAKEQPEDQQAAEEQPEDQQAAQLEDQQGKVNCDLTDHHTVCVVFQDAHCICTLPNLLLLQQDGGKTLIQVCSCDNCSFNFPLEKSGLKMKDFVKFSTWVNKNVLAGT